jgi:hypothetical protein
LAIVPPGCELGAEVAASIPAVAGGVVEAVSCFLQATAANKHKAAIVGMPIALRSISQSSRLGANSTGF